jgi:O-acetylhomoserine (thiol)-lyase
MDRHVENTLALAKWLQSNKWVEKVNYPGLEVNPYHALAKKYLPKGAGGVLSFVLKAEKSRATKLVEYLNIVSHLANVGDAKTLIIEPSATTHSQLSPAEQESAGIEPGLFRVSVGIEHIDDIIADFDQAIRQTVQ